MRLMELAPLLAQHKMSKAAADYEHHGKSDKCRDCRYYLPSDCTRVDKNSAGDDSGKIDPGGWCKLFSAKVK